MPVNRVPGFMEQLGEMLEGYRMRYGMEPIYLGGAGGAGGGGGLPPGGFIGQLAQRYVAYDTSELAAFTSSGSSLVDNLIRLRAMASATFRMTNSSGSAAVAGDVVVIDSLANASFKYSSTLNDGDVVGVVRESIANGASGWVTAGGYVSSVKVDSPVVPGNYLYHSTSWGKATPATSMDNAGCLGRALSSGSTTVEAVIYLVHSSSGGASRERVWFYG